MKKILILVDRFGSGGRFLSEYVSKNLGEGSESVLAKYSDLLFEIEDGEPKVLVKVVDIREFSLVYFRLVGHTFLSTAVTLALCLDKLGIKYYDSKYREAGAAGDKFTSLAKLAFGGVPVIQTMFLWKDHVVEYSPLIMKRLGTPLIVKDYAAQGNTAIYIARNSKDFEALIPIKIKEREAQFLFQKFIHLDCEFRLLVLKDRVSVAHTKAIRDYGSFKVTEDSPEDNLTFIDPNNIPDNLKEIAIRASKILGIEVAGVDVCVEKETGKAYVIEVNRGPGFLHDPDKSPELAELAKFLAREITAKND